MDGRGANFGRLLAIGRAADPDIARTIVAILAASVATGLAELASIGAVVPVVAAATGEPFAVGPLRLSASQWAILFALLVAATAGLRLALNRFTLRKAVGLADRIAVVVHGRILAQPYAWHVRQHSSALVTALHRVDELLYVVLLPLLQAVAATIVGVSIMLLLAATAWTYALAGAAVLGILYVGLSRWSGDALRRHGAAADALYERQVRLLQDSSGAIRDLIVGGRQPYFAAAFATSSAALAEARRGKDVLANAPRFLVEAVGAIGLAAALVLAGRVDGGLVKALPLLALLALAFVRLLPLAQQVYRGWAGLHANQAVIDEIAAFVALPPAPQRSSVPIPFAERVTLDDVAFTYPDGTAVISGANLSIAKGEWIGLTGPSGSGKSTIGDIVSGLLEPTKGTLKVDGLDIDAVNVTGWQARVAPVSQAVFLSDESIARNIAFAAGSDVQPEQIRQAAKLAELEDWIHSRPEGLDGPVGEAGKRISGGQRQRIGIARALAGDADFLILDEATSALDAATEEAILANIRRARPGLTVLVMSHREAALAACDRVYRVEGGRVTAC